MKNLLLNGKIKKSVVVEGNVVKIIQNKSLLVPEKSKTIPIAQISSVEVKKPNPFTNGYIQFSIAGQSSPNTMVGGTFEAAKDENTVMFSGNDNYEIALQIKEYIERYVPVNKSQQIVSNADEIMKFKKLLDDGIITQEEFNRKKDELLK